MKPGKVRSIALCVFRKEDRILVQEGYDPIKQQVFYRPLGGTIEFGERGQETVIRELLEEIGQEVDHVRYLGTLENIFIYNGQMGHEIVLVYDGRFSDPEVYTWPEIHGLENGEKPLKVVWINLAGYRSQPGAKLAPLYPTGLVELLSETP